jgi:hypothetical protein
VTVELDTELVRELARPERRALQDFWRALMLARDVDTFEALLAGESVPLERLEPEWVERFGRREP